MDHKVERFCEIQGKWLEAEKSNASREGVSETMEKFMINLYNEEKFHSSFIEIFENLQRCNSGIDSGIEAGIEAVNSAIAALKKGKDF